MTPTAARPMTARSTRRRGVTVATLAAAGLLLPALSACAPASDGEASPSPTLLAIAGGGAGGAHGGSDGADAGQADAGDGEAGDADLGGPGCPAGIWVLDNPSWERALEQLWQATAPGVEVEVSGELTLDWNQDGSYTLTANANQAVMSGVIDGQAFAMTILHQGVERGAWSQAGPDVYEFASTDVSDWGSAVTMRAGGGEYSVSGDEAPPEPWSGSIAVVCTPAGMTTTADDGVGTMTVDFVPAR